MKKIKKGFKLTYQHDEHSEPKALRVVEKAVLSGTKPPMHSNGRVLGEMPYVMKCKVLTPGWYKFVYITLDDFVKGRVK